MSLELHFYPGKKTLIVRQGAKVMGTFSAYGGPSKLGSDPRMAEEPTTPGVYRIGKTETYRTPTWLMSKIKWGVELQDQGAGKDDVYYKLANGRWASVKKDTGITRATIMQQYYDLYGQNKVPSTWVFNDFGPIAIRWYKDVNDNKKQDANEPESGQMFHTTPNDEASVFLGQPLRMTESHGCIHLNPIERDQLIKMGAFNPGTLFTVHGYDESP